MRVVEHPLRPKYSRRRRWPSSLGAAASCVLLPWLLHRSDFTFAAVNFKVVAGRTTRGETADAAAVAAEQKKVAEGPPKVPRSADQEELGLLLREERSADWHWRQFSSKNKLPIGTKLASVPDETAQQFLANYSAGSFGAQIEYATDDMIAQLSELRLSTKTAHWQWEQHCNRTAMGLANPRKLPVQVLRDFLAAHAAGDLEEVEIGSEEMVNQVERFRKKPGGPRLWASFLKEHYVSSISDPGRLPEQLVRRFLANAGLHPKERLRSALVKRLQRELKPEDIVYEVKEDPAMKASSTPLMASLVLSKDVNADAKQPFRSFSYSAMPLSFNSQWSPSKKIAMDKAAEEALNAIFKTSADYEAANPDE